MQSPANLDSQFPLHHAASTAQPALIHHLLTTDAAINPNLQTPSGQTALHLAVHTLSLAAVQALLAHPSTNPDLPNKDGKTPLMLIAQSRAWTRDAPKGLEFPVSVVAADPEEASVAILRALLETGRVDVERRDEDGFTAVSLGIRDGFGGVVRVLFGDETVKRRCRPC